MDEIVRAMHIAKAAHAGQLYGDREPYIGHVERVAGRVQHFGGTPEQVAAAWLHDVVEDGRRTVEGLRERGVSEPVIALVVGLTRRVDERGVKERYHAGFIARCADDPALRLIKRCDVEENYAALLGAFPPDQAAGMRRRYERALEMLKEEIE